MPRYRVNLNVLVIDLLSEDVNDGLRGVDVRALDRWSTSPLSSCWLLQYDAGAMQIRELAYMKRGKFEKKNLVDKMKSYPSKV